MSDEPTLTTTGGDTPVFARYVHTCCDHADAWRALAVELGEALRKAQPYLARYSKSYLSSQAAQSEAEWLARDVMLILRRLQERQEATK